MQRTVDGLNGGQGGWAQLATTHGLAVGLAGGQLMVDARQPEPGVDNLCSGGEGFWRCPDSVQASHANLGQHGAAEARAIAILPHLGIQPEQLADDLVHALALAAYGELGADVLDRGKKRRRTRLPLADGQMDDVVAPDHVRRYRI